MKKTLFLLAFLMTIVLGAKADSFFDTTSMSAQDQNKPIGWGAAVTGGEELNQVTVTTLSELQSALTGSDKKTIIVDGTITFTGSVTIQGVENKSIYGEPGAILQNLTHTATVANTGIMYLKNCSNIIIRNLTFKGAGAYDVDGNDNLTLDNCSNIWVDHCDFQDGVDGNFDCKNGSDNICVSWCRFRYLKEPWAGGSGGSDDHRFTNLWGSGDTASGDEGHLNTTFVNCWWDKGCKQRMPRVRFGKIHLLNCYYSSSVADYCVGGGYKSNVYIEKCAFTGSGEPWRNFATSGVYTDYNYTITGCTGAADDQGSSGGADYYTPAYAYTSYEASSVASVVSNASNGAGATLQLPSISGSVTWTIGNEASPTISAEITESVLTTGRTVGSGLTATAATYLESSMVAYQPSTSNPGAVETAMIEYRVSVYPGLEFTPTSVSYNAVKDGTDNATYSWSYTLDGVESAITQVSKDDIVRNSNTSGTPPMLHTHALSASKCNEFTFRIYVSGFANNKKLGIGNVVINGKVSGEKAALDNYTVTYENNDVAASGIAPAAVNVVQYESTTIPTNRTLFKEGYTLTGWTDGISTYAIGDAYVPTGDVTLTPVFTANTVELADALKDITVTWDFQRQNGAPNVQWQNRTNDLLVTQAKVNGVFIDVKLGINTNPGKFNNSSWTDWCQVNEGTTFTLPSKAGASVKAFSMNEPKNGSDVKSTLDGNAYSSFSSNVATYSTTEDAGTSTLTIKGGSYYRYVQLIYPGSGAAWANFEDFEMDLRNGNYIHSDEKSNITIGFKKDGENIVRSTADDDDNIGTLTGRYHSDEHGLQGFSMSVAVPGYVKISAGTCAWGGNLTINGTNSFSHTVNTNTGACYHQNTTANKVYAYYTVNEGTTLTIAGGNYMPYIAVEAVDFYAITGTIDGGNIDGKKVILTSELTGQAFEATVSSNAFTLNVPADTYTVTLSDNDDYVISSPASVVVSADAPLTINIIAATPQSVTGQITNAPAEAFTLTFTGANNNKNVEMAAGATSYTTTLTPDTYTISSNVGSLSPLSVESFQVVKDAVTHNIYFPEAAVPAATQQNITVDNTLPAASANNYKTVTDALAAAKAGKISNPVITLTSGQTYMEQVIVDQPGVTLKTSGAGKAKITFYYGIGYTYYSLGANGLYDKDRANTRNSIKMIDPVRWGTTILVKSTANNFKAENIIFENSFNQYYTDEEVVDGVRPNGLQSITYDRTLTSGEGGYKAADAKAVTERAAAIAIENGPTGVELYNCEFVGSQDTFYSSGTIYVKNCNIIGNTDYIFGGGYVVFDDCDLTIGGYSDQNATAYITAYKDGNEWNSAKKYVFRDCTVKTLATPRAYYAANLGRDWGGPAASVYYFNLKNEIGNKLSYSWTSMSAKGISDATADLHVYDFDPTINANFKEHGSDKANINSVLSDDNATMLYTEVVSRLGFTPAHIYDLQLDETNNHNAIKIAAANGSGLAGDVTLKRSITEGKWSTIVLPFAVSADKLITAFGPDYKLAELTTGDENTLNFTTQTAMEACKPYAIKVSVPFISATFEDVYIDSTTPEQTVGNWVFNGTYTSQTAPVDSYVFSGNKLRKVTGNNVTVKPFRAYITYNGVAPANELEFILDGETTGLSEELRVESGEFATATYYDLQGRKVVNGSWSSQRHTLSERMVNGQLKKGVYIVNGRKTIVK